MSIWARVVASLIDDRTAYGMIGAACALILILAALLYFGDPAGYCQ